jgi:hypothetical protein
MSDNPILDLEQQLLTAHSRISAITERSLPATGSGPQPGERDPDRPEWKLRRRPRRWHALGLIAAALVAGGCAAATIVLTGEKSGQLTGALPRAFDVAPLKANRYDLEIAPDLMAGKVGWCVSFELLEDARPASLGGGPCSAINGPLVGGGLAGISGSAVIYDVITARVAAVRLSAEHLHRLVIPVSNPHIPYGWKIAVATVKPLTRVINHRRMRLVLPILPTVSLLNPQLRSIPLDWTRGEKITSLPVRTVNPLHPAASSCAIRVGALAGLSAVSESVLREAPTNPASTGGPGYLSCASVELRFDGNPVIAAILLNAQHPGTRPAPLPETHPLAGDRQTYVGPGAEEVGFLKFGFSYAATITARRVGDAWLVIQGPAGQQSNILNVLHTHT